MKAALNEVKISLVYPFKGKGKYLFGATMVLYVLFWGIDYVTRTNVASIMRVVLNVGLGVYFMRMMYDSAYGRNTIPSLPEYKKDYFMSYVKGPLFRYLITRGVYLGLPAVILNSPLLEGAEKGPALALIVLGGIIFPMAFMSVTVLEDIRAIDPFECVKKIFKSPFSYASLCVIFYFVVWMPGELLSYAEGEIVALWGVIVMGISYYATSVLMNVMGRYYLSHAKEFGWME